MSKDLSELAVLALGDPGAKAELLKALGITVLSNGTSARVTKPGEITIDKVRVYVSEKGGVHFQGVKGTSRQYGMTLYADTIEWIIDHQNELIDFMFTNKEQLSTKPPKTT